MTYRGWAGVVLSILAITVLLAPGLPHIQGAPVRPPTGGPALLLRAGVVDQRAQTVTLPLLAGRMKDGRKVWYIVTDSSDGRVAAQRGVNHSAKLANAPTGGTRMATREPDGSLTFDNGTVDFSPVRTVIAGSGSHPFPPKMARPGAVADGDYTPLLRIRGGGDVVYNAPVVAFGVDDRQISFCEGRPDLRFVHDRVVKICPEKQTVTLALTPGFSMGRAVLYISTEGTDPGVAAMEAATFAPRLARASPEGGYGEHSQVEPLVVVVNGPTGRTNPRRQGIYSALLDGQPPLNVVGAIPTLGEGYSPLWSVNLAVWTQRAHRLRVTAQSQVHGLVSRGAITGPDGKPFGPIGVIVNCPIVQRLD